MAPVFLTIVSMPPLTTSSKADNAALPIFSSGSVRCVLSAWPTSSAFPAILPSASFTSALPLSTPPMAPAASSAAPAKSSRDPAASSPSPASAASVSAASPSRLASVSVAVAISACSCAICACVVPPSSPRVFMASSAVAFRMSRRSLFWSIASANRLLLLVRSSKFWAAPGSCSALFTSFRAVLVFFNAASAERKLLTSGLVLPITSMVMPVIRPIFQSPISA